jgi:predicted kinase
VGSPRLIVLSGLPATGKSAVADGLARELSLPVLSVDPIESAILDAGMERSFETGLAAYNVVEAIADHQLANGRDAIVDAVNSVNPARDMWRRLAAGHGAKLLIIECVLADGAAHEARLAARARGLAIPEPSWEDVQRRRAEWTPWSEPHLVLDAADPVEANIAKALDFVEGRQPAASFHSSATASS